MPAPPQPYATLPIRVVVVDQHAVIPTCGWWARRRWPPMPSRWSRGSGPPWCCWTRPSGPAVGSPGRRRPGACRWALAGGNGPGHGKHADLPGPFANNDKDSSFEIYSPPYLFRGDRPEITGAPAGVAWGEDFDIGVGAGDEVSKVTLMLMSPQHSHDSDQRSIVLEHVQDGDRVTAAAPPSGTVAPPGYYYHFG